MYKFWYTIDLLNVKTNTELPKPFPSEDQWQGDNPNI